MERGSRIHEEAAVYVKASRKPKLSKDLKSLVAELDELRKNRKLALVEHEVALTSDWAATGWFDDDCWVRIKMDFIELPKDSDSERVLRIIDLKTGQRYPDHRDQIELYALGGFYGAWPAFADDEMPSKVICELWYCDTGEITEAEYIATEADALRKSWDKKVRKMMSDTKFKATPGGSCRRCAFAASKDGPCKYGA